MEYKVAESDLEPILAAVQRPGSSRCTSRRSIFWSSLVQVYSSLLNPLLTNFLIKPLVFCQYSMFSNDIIFSD